MWVIPANGEVFYVIGGDIMEFIDKDKYANNIGIYRIRNTVNNFVYIGQTSDKFWNRFLEHKNKLMNWKHKNSKLMNDWIKYGENSFVFEVVFIVRDPSVLDELEVKYISENKLLGLSYNKKNGGDHVFITENGIKSVKEYMSNRIIKDETKQKLRMANLGDNNPVRKICEKDVVDIKTRIISHENQNDIANSYNVSLGLISAIANNRTWTHVVVDGWEEYLSSKRKKHFLTEQEIAEIKELLKNENANQSEIARKYHTYSSVINSIYHKKTHNDNTVPSSNKEKV